METVAFNSIGFTAALILNRLRNENQIHAQPEEDGEAVDKNREDIGSELAVTRVGRRNKKDRA